MSVLNWLSRYGLLLIALVAVLLFAGVARGRSADFRRQAQVLVAALFEFVALLVIALRAMPLTTWQVLTALLPLVLVLYHSMNLWRERLKVPEAIVQDMTHQDVARGESGVYEARREVVRRILEDYGWDAIVARYVIPAALIPIVGLVEFRLINDPSLLLGLSRERLLAPLEYGLVGAYFFVFLELGRRSVRNDITPVSILWCLITLVLGPTLAALIPSIFTATITGSWNDRALWIFAGYSPRLVFQTLSEGIIKSLHIESSVVQEHRQIPLGRIGGIGADETERLAEEGIKDAHSLACVEPVRLMRDTRFDNWRILSWVDQALLLTSVPEDIWRELLKRGYQGATDTKILVRTEQHLPPNWPVRVLKENEAEEILGEIAKAVNANTKVVQDMLVRLVTDPRTAGFDELARALAGWPLRPPSAQSVATDQPTQQARAASQLAATD